MLSFYVSLFYLFCCTSVSALHAGRYVEADATFLSGRGALVRRNETSTIPSCATSCVVTYTTSICGSATNTTCICTDSDYTTAISVCAYTACETPDLFSLQRYAAETCRLAHDDSRIRQVLIVDYILPFLTTLFVVGRICARKILDVGLAWDDWILLAGYFFYLCSVAGSLGMVMNDFGEHAFWLTTDQMITALKFFFFTELSYIVTITLTKLSLLLFFLRIFPSRILIKISWILGIFVVVSNLSILLTLAFQCVPFAAYWTNWMYKNPPVKCLDQFTILNVAAGLSIFHNVAILMVPIPTLWSLNLPWQRKLNLLVMFSVGSVVIVCSCLRLPSLNMLKESNDVSYDQSSIIVYSHLEEAIGLITACLPACRSLLEHFIPAFKLSQADSKGKTNGTGFPGTGTPNGVLGTKRKSFIELDDRRSTMEHGGLRSSNGIEGEKMDDNVELSFEEILAGGPDERNVKSKHDWNRPPTAGLDTKSVSSSQERRWTPGGENDMRVLVSPIRRAEEKETPARELEGRIPEKKSGTGNLSIGIGNVTRIAGGGRELEDLSNESRELTFQEIMARGPEGRFSKDGNRSPGFSPLMRITSGGTSLLAMGERNAKSSQGSTKSLDVSRMEIGVAVKEDIRRERKGSIICTTVVESKHETWEIGVVR